MRWLFLFLTLAACTNKPARETLPVVHVICVFGQGQGIDQYMTRAQYERLVFSQAVPCAFEWGESMPAPVAAPSPAPTASPDTAQ